MKNKITIVRGVWGQNKHTLDEIFEKPIFENEIVYVWGIDNQNYLKKFGYKTHLMSSEIFDETFSPFYLRFLHKIKIIEEACKQFGEFILLDWDCYLIKPLDEKFYEYLTNGNETQMPLYCFPDKKHLEFLDMLFSDRFPVLNRNDEDYKIMSKIETGVRNYSWKLNDWLISPNFSFFYTRNKNIGNELLNLTNLYDVQGISDEHIFFLWVNCTLEEYLIKHEPIVSIGYPNETRFYLLPPIDESTDVICRFNKYVETFVSKNNYFKHI